MPYQKVLFCDVWYFCVKNWKTSRYNISKNVCSSLSACFLFLLLLLLSNNTHHVLFYNYICYWNPFQYIIHYTNLFSCRKTMREWLQKICLLLTTPTFCLSLFCLDYALFHEALLLLRCIQLYLKVLNHIYVLKWYIIQCLTHLSPVSYFYTPWKRQKIFGFLMFSGGIEMWHWTKIG